MSENIPAVPNHLGFVLDGNRRWAQERGLTAFEGHRAGYNVLKDIGVECLDQGVRYITAYLFSTENWKRDAKEVSYLMDLFLMVAKKDVKFALKHGIRLCFLGRRDVVSPALRRAMSKAEEATKDQTRGTFAVCIDYGGQQEIADAARKCVEDGLRAEEITPEAIQSRLYAPDIPPLDLIVRTSGEQRISNFMLWRAAYSELLFLQKYWPEMTKSDVIAIIEEYGRRSRRFGG